ncbi:sigma-70 family RNA polymerase sigma factor [Verrucomicrobiales bacterium]|nr:sigma-70 family RNA polymerase sigma factor [Verrucomicrobiales bacterium]
MGNFSYWWSSIVRKMSLESENNHYEQFVKLFSKHEPGLRRFVRSLVYSWDDVDDVMQNTGLVLWRKFSDFDPKTNFMSWASVVARFEVLTWKRDRARDRHVFDDDLISMLADETDAECEKLILHRRALDQCLKKLPDDLRRVVVAAYEPGVKLNEVAERIGSSATGFYKKLRRTRESLMVCIEAEVASQEGSVQ